eukprot:scaffold236_cov228-Pinguiococcus_pyrenoidosus.AAC.5
MRFFANLCEYRWPRCLHSRARGCAGQVGRLTTRVAGVEAARPNADATHTAASAAHANARGLQGSYRRSVTLSSRRLHFHSTSRFETYQKAAGVRGQQTGNGVLADDARAALLRAGGPRSDCRSPSAWKKERHRPLLRTHRRTARQVRRRHCRRPDSSAAGTDREGISKTAFPPVSPSAVQSESATYQSTTRVRRAHAREAVLTNELGTAELRTTIPSSAVAGTTRATGLGTADRPRTVEHAGGAEWHGRHGALFGRRRRGHAAARVNRRQGRDDNWIRHGRWLRARSA